MKGIPDPDGDLLRARETVERLMMSACQTYQHIAADLLAGKIAPEEREQALEQKSAYFWLHYQLYLAEQHMSSAVNIRRKMHERDRLALLHLRRMREKGVSGL